MEAQVRSAPYYYVRIEGSPDDAYRWLAEAASDEVDLQAFSAVPYGPHHMELTLFPVDRRALETSAAARGWDLVGPYRALLIQGDDTLGALRHIHEELHHAGVGVYATTGVTDGEGRFGYIVNVRERDVDAAAQILNAEDVRPER